MCYQDMGAGKQGCKHKWAAQVEVCNVRSAEATGQYATRLPEDAGDVYAKL